MLKLILIAAIIWLVFVLMKKYGRSIEKSSGAAEPDRVEDMVRCSHCGVFLPRNEAIMSGGKFFCSAEHRKLSQG